MKDTGFGEKVVSQPFDPVPGHAILLAPSPERTQPEFGDVVAERVKRATICRHRMIREEAGYDLPQPFPLFGDRLMHSPSHLLLDLLERRPHAIDTGFSLQCEAPAA
jgi:hypothetical protein